MQVLFKDVKTGKLIGAAHNFYSPRGNRMDVLVQKKLENEGYEPICSDYEYGNKVVMRRRRE